jgi:ganglioside-induced differentiation-associated protein 1
MLLFTGRNSICTQKVLITLFEKGLTWDTKRVDLFKNEQYDPAYLKYNPKGVVPTLVHNDKPIVESTFEPLVFDVARAREFQCRLRF